jgi:hypothetical protein
VDHPSTEQLRLRPDRLPAASRLGAHWSGRAPERGSAARQRRRPRGGRRGADGVPVLALPIHALPIHALPILARPILARPILARPILARPILALAILALAILAIRARA